MVENSAVVSLEVVNVSFIGSSTIVAFDADWVEEESIPLVVASIVVVSKNEGIGEKINKPQTGDFNKFDRHCQFNMLEYPLVRFR